MRKEAGKIDEITIKQRKINKSLIARRCRHYAERNPGLKDLLRFYRKVFSLQKEAQGSLPRRLPHIEGAQVAYRLDGGELLIKPEELEVDLEVLEGLFKGLGELFVGRGGDAAGILGSFLEGKGKRELELLVNAFQYKDEEKFLSLAGEEEAEVVYSLLHLSLAPFYWRMAEPLAKQAPLGQVPRGTCPVCGDLPVMGLIRSDDGVRILECSLCGVRWGIPRMICPFCMESDQERLGYLYAERDRAHRVYICDNCHKYLKVTLQESEKEEEIVLALEDLATMDLDRAAEDRGYLRGCRTAFS